MLPDENGDVHAPPPSTAPVVVQPIQAHQSRTLRTAFWATIGAVVAALPDVIATIASLMSYPEIAEVVYRYVPVQARAVIGIVYIVLMQSFARLRKVTVAPIAGTESAREMLPLKDAQQTTLYRPISTGGTK